MMTLIFYFISSLNAAIFARLEQLKNIILMKRLKFQSLLNKSYFIYNLYSLKLRVQFYFLRTLRP